MRSCLLAVSLPFGRVRTFRLSPREGLPVSLQISNKLVEVGRLVGQSPLALDYETTWVRS